MYICICKAITDTQIREAVQEGVTSMSGLRQTLGCSGQCGKCAKHVKQVRDDALCEMSMIDGQKVIPLYAVA